MDPDEVIVCELKGSGCFQILQLFAERVRQPGESPHAHQHG